MRAKYIGDPELDGEGPRTILQWGHYFPKGAWTDIEAGKDGDDARRLAPGHPHFEVDSSPTKTKASANEATATILTDADLGTPTVDAAVQAKQEEAEKAFLREKITELGGTQPHPLTGLTKLREAVAAAQEAYDFANG